MIGPNILNHRIHLNNMYLSRVTQMIDSLHYKDQLMILFRGMTHNCSQELYKTRKKTAWRKCIFYVKVDDV